MSTCRKTTIFHGGTTNVQLNVTSATHNISSSFRTIGAQRSAFFLFSVCYEHRERDAILFAMSLLVDGRDLVVNLIVSCGKQES
jgi:hypothetical protein